MEVGLDQVQGDMRVYGSDGENLGMATGVKSDPSTNPPTRYLEVNRSAFLGLLGDDLWVPEAAIASIVLGGVSTSPAPETRRSSATGRSPHRRYR
jgi:hypothetical protein